MRETQYQSIKIGLCGRSIKMSLKNIPPKFHFPSHFQFTIPSNNSFPSLGMCDFTIHFLSIYSCQRIGQITQTMTSSSSNSRSNIKTIEYYINASHCECPIPLPVEVQTSWTRKHPGRRFKACPIWVRLLYLQNST